MSTLCIAVASTPLTATLTEAVPAALAAIDEAARLGARIVCLPETGLPGHRNQARHVPDVSSGQLEEALGLVSDAARMAGVVTIVGAERPTASGRQIVSVVFDADGSRLGEQVKTQIDPSEEPAYVAGTGRRVFTAAGLTFGIAICHEAYRYPEITRALVLEGAQVVFVPHFVTTSDGSLPTRWCDPSNPYNEKSLLSRALENSVYIAQSNVAGSAQGSLTGIVAPDGTLVAGLDYGVVGVVAADIELDLATRQMALRWAPERNTLTGSSGLSVDPPGARGDTPFVPEPPEPVESTAHYANGKVKFTGWLIDGEMHGAWSWYRTDGSTMRIGQFDRGRQTGAWRTFDRSGRVVKETDFG